MYVGVVVHHQRQRHGQRLVVSEVAADGAVEHAYCGRAQQVVMDVVAQIVHALDRHTPGLQELDQIGILPQVVIQRVVCVCRALRAESFPDQVSDHPAGFPLVVRVVSPIRRVPQPLLPVIVVGVDRGEPGQQDCRLVRVLRITGEQPCLGQ